MKDKKIELLEKTYQAQLKITKQKGKKLRNLAKSLNGQNGQLSDDSQKPTST